MDVLVETEVSLISPGTEGASLLALPNTGTEFPQYPGYSNVGRVLEVGGEVEGIKPGDRFSSHGAHASHVVIQSLPEHSVRRGTLDGIDPSSSKQTLRRSALVPDGLGSDTAAFANLCAISLQGVRKARIELGESVLVIGQGLVGNLAAQFARLDGGYPVMAADLSEQPAEHISRDWCGPYYPRRERQRQYSRGCPEHYERGRCTSRNRDDRCSGSGRYGIQSSRMAWSSCTAGKHSRRDRTSKLLRGRSQEGADHPGGPQLRAPGQRHVARLLAPGRRPQT